MADSDTKQGRARFGLGTMTWWLFGAVGLGYLLTGQADHASDYLPYLLLIACPLLHTFQRFSGYRRTDRFAPGGARQVAKKQAPGAKQAPAAKQAPGAGSS